MSRSVACFCLAVLVGGLLLTAPRSADAWSSLDLKGWLNQPGVKLVAVEFYATWCKPCMKAVPKWKALHEKYRARGLRLIVVSVQDQGTCANPDWSPDAVICDEDGVIQSQWKADSLPQAFLWSWQGNLLAAHAGADQVEAAVEKFYTSSPRILVGDPVAADGGKLADGGALRGMIRSELARAGKFDLVASEAEKAELRKLRKEGYGGAYDEKTRCKLGREVSANSHLKATLREGKKPRLILELFSVEDGCLGASAKAPVVEGDLDAAVVDAVGQLVRMLAGDVVFPGGPAGPATVRITETNIGEKPEDWNPDLVQPVIVQFESEPTGAIVFVDGKLLCQDTSKGCSRMVAPGTRTVAMQKEGYAERSESVKIAKATNINWKLSATFGTLTVKSHPSGLKIQVNGADSGRTPLEGVKLAPGPYEIVVSDSRYYETGKRIMLEQGEQELVELEPKPRQGAISVVAVNNDGNAIVAKVFVDGAKVGETPYTGKVIIGVHQVRVVSGGAKWEEAVDVREKKVENLSANLDVAMAKAKKIERLKEDEQAERERRVAESLYFGAAAVEGFAIYDGGLYRTNFTTDFTLGYRIARPLLFWIEMAYGYAFEEPNPYTIYYGIRTDLASFYLRGGLTYLMTDNGIVGGLTAAGYSVHLGGGIYVEAEADISWFKLSVIPVTGRLGLRWSM